MLVQRHCLIYDTGGVRKKDSAQGVGEDGEDVASQQRGGVQARRWENGGGCHTGEMKQMSFQGVNGSHRHACEMGTRASTLQGVMSSGQGQKGKIWVTTK